MELPSSLLGLKIEHKLKDEDSGVDEWYSGEVTGQSGDSLTIFYVGYDGEFSWTLAEISEDFKNNDFVIKQ